MNSYEGAGDGGIGFHCAHFLQQNMDIFYLHSLDAPNSFSVATYYLISLYCLEHSNGDITLL